MEFKPIWKEGDLILDLYRVIAMLGEGGFGKVYKVRHTGWNVDLAMKFPKPERVAEVGGVENFEREAETWVNLGLHLHTVSCYYVRRVEGNPLVFAEYVAGGSLHDWIYQRKLYEGGTQAALKRILDIAIQFAWGLHYAHEQGLIHQDVKPGNVMVTPQGTVKVTDFGLAGGGYVASVIESNDTLPAQHTENTLVTEGGGAMTPAYCSPEQAEGKLLTRRSDLWSWGLCVLEMFQGERTWVFGAIAADALESYRQSEAKFSALPLMPDSVTELLQRCFRENPDERPRTMLDVANELQKIYQQEIGEIYPRTHSATTQDIADSLNNRAVSLFDLGKQEEALTLWEEALQVQPHHPESTYNRGLILWRKALINDDVLIRNLEQVKQSYGNWVVDYLLSQIHLERKDYETATRLLDRIYSQNPEVKEIQDSLEKAKNIQSDFPLQQQIFSEQKSFVRATCLSSDFRYLLSVDSENYLKLWDITTGECLWKIQEPLRTYDYYYVDYDSVKQVTGTIDNIDLSADGCFAIYGITEMRSSWQDSNKFYLKFLTLDPVSKQVQSTKKLASQTGSLTYLQFSPDSRMVWFKSDGKTHTWDITTDEYKSVTAKLGNSILFSSDNHFIISEEGNNLKQWEISTGKSMKTFSDYSNNIKAVCLSNDNCLVMSTQYATINNANSLDNNILKLWEVSTGKCLQSFNGNIKSISYGALSYDNYFALSGNDNVLKLWEIKSGRCLHTFEFEYKLCRAYLRDNNLLIFTSAKEKLFLLLQINLSNSYQASLRLSQLLVTEEAISINSIYKRALEEARLAQMQGDYISTIRHLKKARSQPGCNRLPEVINAWSNLYAYLPRKSLLGIWEKHIISEVFQDLINIKLSSDGRFILGRSKAQNAEDTALNIYDIATEKKLETFSIQGELLDFKLASKLALSKKHKKVYLWNLKTGECLQTFPDYFGDGLSFAKLIGDDRFVLSGSQRSNIIALWNVETGEYLRTFKENWGDSLLAIMSVDNRFILSGSDRHKTLRFWDVTTGKCLQIFEGHTENITSLHLSNDSRLALSGSRDKTLKLWEVATGKCLQTLQGHTDEILSVCLSADGQFAMSGSRDKTIKLWNAVTGKCLWTFEEDTAVTDVNFTNDDRLAFSNSQNGIKVWILDWDLKEQIPVDWDESARPYLEIFLHQHNPYSAILSANFSPLISTIEGHTDRVNASCLSNDGKFAISASRDKTLKLWDVATGKCLRVLEGHKRKYKLPDSDIYRESYYAALSVALSTDNQLALTGGEDKKLKLWDITTGECFQTFEGHTGQVNSVCFSQDNRYALSGGGFSDNTLKLWEITTGNCLRTFQGHTFGVYGEHNHKQIDGVNSAYLNYDSTLALSGGHDKTVRLWDVATGECLRIFRGHNRAVLSVCLSRDNRLVLSGGLDEIKLWDVGTGECLYTIFERGSIVNFLNFNNDKNDDLILFADAHGQWKLWDIKNGRCFYTFTGHLDDVTSISLSADGRFSLTGSQDKTLKLWNLDLFLLEQRKGEIGLALTRQGTPTWTEADFENLLYTLGCAGYGYLCPESVRAQLEAMARGEQTSFSIAEAGEESLHQEPEIPDETYSQESNVSTTEDFEENTTSAISSTPENLEHLPNVSSTVPSVESQPFPTSTSHSSPNPYRLTRRNRVALMTFFCVYISQVAILLSVFGLGGISSFLLLLLPALILTIVITQFFQ